MGALVIYADLWTDRGKSPASLVYEDVRTTLSDLAAPGTQLLARFKGLNLGAAGLVFGFQVEAVGKSGGATLGEVFTEWVDARSLLRALFQRPMSLWARILSVGSEGRWNGSTASNCRPTR